jgi:hypothetical protein
MKDLAFVDETLESVPAPNGAANIGITLSKYPTHKSHFFGN